MCNVIKDLVSYQISEMELQKKHEPVEFMVRVSNFIYKYIYIQINFFYSLILLELTH